MGTLQHYHKLTTHKNRTQSDTMKLLYLLLSAFLFNSFSAFKLKHINCGFDVDEVINIRHRNNECFKEIMDLLNEKEPFKWDTSKCRKLEQDLRKEEDSVLMKRQQKNDFIKAKNLLIKTKQCLDMIME